MAMPLWWTWAESNRRPAHIYVNFQGDFAPTRSCHCRPIKAQVNRSKVVGLDTHTVRFRDLSYQAVRHRSGFHPRLNFRHTLGSSLNIRVDSGRGGPGWSEDLRALAPGRQDRQGQYDASGRFPGRLLLLTTAVQWLVPLQARPRTRAFASSRLALRHSLAGEQRWFSEQFW